MLDSTGAPFTPVTPVTPVRRSRLILIRALVVLVVLVAGVDACASGQPGADDRQVPRGRSPAPIVGQSEQDGYHHWRTVGVASMTTPSPGGHCDDADLASLAANDGSTLQWIACTDASRCTTPTDLHFMLPDFASVSDATLTFDGVASGADARASIGCLDVGGAVVSMVPARSYGAARENHRWELAPSCLRSDVVVRITRLGRNCLGPDHVGLNVKSVYRRVPLASVNGPVEAPGTCTDACVHDLAEDDGTSLEWIACSSTDHLATPTDFHYLVPDASAVEAAILTLRTHASGGDARASITCVDASGAELGQIAPDVTFTPAAATYAWAVPPACFAAPGVTVRVARTGADCLGPDYLSLDVAASARAVSIASSPTAGTCAGSGCIDALNVKDGAYFTRWIACDPSSGYVTPTDLRFETPEHDSVSRAWMVIDTVASGPDARLIGTCIDDAGANLAVIFPETRFGEHARARTFEVPTRCFTSNVASIRLARVGRDCIGPDYVRLYTESGAAPGRIHNAHTIEGYADASSVAPGENLDFRVHAPRGHFSVEVVRYGPTPTTMLDVGPIRGEAQDYLEDADSFGAGFATSYRLAVPSTWASGLYAARLHDGASEFYVTFVVREQTLGVAPLLLLASTNTWNAYDAWAGKSFYNYAPRDESGRAQNSHASTKRPRPSATPLDRKGHLAGADRSINEWLESSGYAYGELADDDVETDPSVLGRYAAVILGTHSEYWSQRMYDGLTAYLDGGGNLLYLGGNGIYWRITRDGDTIEARKNGSSHEQTGDPGGLWRDLGRPESSVLGVQYDRSVGCSKKIAYPYEVLAPAHWVFAGTGVVAGTLIGAGGSPSDCGTGAAGWEVDHVTERTPPGYVLLARGTGTENADLIYYRHRGGGGVFSVGSLNWARTLGDPRTGAITRNVIHRFTGM